MTSPTEVFDRLLEIALLLQEDMARSFRGTALTAARTHVLWELNRLGPSTQQSLAVALAVSPRNITGLVDALAASSYVERRPHPTDRRAVLVTLSDLGTETVTGMVRDREEAANQLTADFDPSRLEQFRHDLDHIADRLRVMVEGDTGGTD